MTPPQASEIGDSAQSADLPSAVSHFVPLETLRHRPDFLKAASARRQGTGSFLLQARARDDGQPAARIGFTASKKIGNAVARNRAKRRMRVVARQVLTREARAGWDYVLVARPDATTSRDFTDLVADLKSALQSVHRDRK